MLVLGEYWGGMNIKTRNSMDEGDLEHSTETVQQIV
jgi:hypothetical protein